MNITMTGKNKVYITEPESSVGADTITILNVTGESDGQLRLDLGEHNDISDFIILSPSEDGINLREDDHYNFWHTNNGIWKNYKDADWYNKGADTISSKSWSTLVEEAPYHPGYEGAVFQESKAISEKIKGRLLKANKRFNANDNIAEFIKDGELELLVEELTGKFAGVLDTLVIDRVNDPNSKDTAKRLAKMYIYELMDGRYTNRPDVTSFPNEGSDRFEGMLCVRAEITSMCSHHHQPVSGVVIIGIIPTGRVIGLSKYVRIIQWCARRGQLQEDLVNQIAKEIMHATDTENVAVYIQATHGCMENRGVEAHSSLTQTSVVHGLFHNDSVKAEFFNNVKLQLSK